MDSGRTVGLVPPVLGLGVSHVTTEVVNGQTVHVKHCYPGRALGARFDRDGAHDRIRELVARPIARSGWHYSKLYAS